MSDSILLVDDNLNFRNSVQLILQSENYDISTAATGREVFHKIQSRTFGVILLDLFLPDLNGIEIAEFLTENQPDTAVIILTGQASIETAAKAVHLGCYDYLCKPCCPTKLKQTIHRAIDHYNLKVDLRKSSLKYQRLAEASWEAVALFSQTRIIDVNQRFCQLFNIDEQSAAEHCIEDFLPDLLSVNSNLYDKITTEHGVFQTEAITKNGDIFAAEYRLKMVPDSVNHKWIVTIRDLTERQLEESQKRQLEEKLGYAMRMESIGLMTGTVAHDLNNILTNIVTYPELLLLDLEPGTQQRRQIERIKNAGEKAVDVVADLLTIARGSVSQQETCNLNTIVEEYRQSLDLLEYLRTSPNIQFELDLAPDLDLINASTLHITQSLTNLVRNGIEAVGGSGSITIGSFNRHLKKSHQGCELIPAGRYVVISVYDTGQGIALKHLPQIFEPFYSTKQIGKSGSGLGLTVIMHTMRDHSGFIDITSSEAGTKFELYFPRVEQTTFASTPILPPLKSLRGNGEKILIIEDEKAQRILTSAILTRLGYTPFCAPNGEQAIKIVEKLPIDLLLLDLVMEPGMNGFDTFQEIRKMYPQQKVVITSGYHDHPDRDKIASQGVTNYLPKPIKITHLALALHAEMKN